MGMSSGRTGLDATLDDRTRDACLHSLGDRYAAGRLTASELESRIQAALAAETEAELAAVMEDVTAAAVADEQPVATDRPTRTVQLVRWGAGGLVLVAGALLLAVVGPDSNAVELAVGVAVGLLGFLTPWWLSERSDRAAVPAARSVPEARPSAPVLRDDDERAADGADEQHVLVVEPEQPPVAEVRPIRPVGRGNGLIPGQRRGD